MWWRNEVKLTRKFVCFGEIHPREQKERRQVENFEGCSHLAAALQTYLHMVSNSTLKSRQIHFAASTNTFCKCDKYIFPGRRLSKPICLWCPIALRSRIISVLGSDIQDNRDSIPVYVNTDLNFQRVRISDFQKQAPYWQTQIYEKHVGIKKYIYVDLSFLVIPIVCFKCTKARRCQPIFLRAHSLKCCSWTEPKYQPLDRPNQQRQIKIKLHNLL